MAATRARASAPRIRVQFNRLRPSRRPKLFRMLERALRTRGDQAEQQLHCAQRTRRAQVSPQSCVLRQAKRGPRSRRPHCLGSSRQAAAAGQQRRGTWRLQRSSSSSRMPCRMASPRMKTRTTTAGEAIQADAVRCQAHPRHGCSVPSGCPGRLRRLSARMRPTTPGSRCRRTSEASCGPWCAQRRHQQRRRRQWLTPLCLLWRQARARSGTSVLTLLLLGVHAGCNCAAACAPPAGHDSSAVGAHPQGHDSLRAAGEARSSRAASSQH